MLFTSQYGVENRPPLSAQTQLTPVRVMRVAPSEVSFELSRLENRKWHTSHPPKISPPRIVLCDLAGLRTPVLNLRNFVPLERGTKYFVHGRISQCAFASLPPPASGHLAASLLPCRRLLAASSVEHMQPVHPPRHSSIPSPLLHAFATPPCPRHSMDFR